MKKRLFVFLFVIPLALSGCSTQFVYNNIDWLIHWYLDDYVDLTKSQKKRFDGKMQLWLSWHKNTELASYQAQLTELKRAISEEVLTPRLWLHHSQLAREHWFRFRNTLSPDLLELAMELSNEQIEELFAALEQKTQAWQQERAGKSHEALSRLRAKELTDRIKPWTGKLNQAQKQLIADYSRQHISSFQSFIQYRRNWQARAKALLLDRESQDFKPLFLQLLTEPERFRPPELTRTWAVNRQLRAQLMSDLHASLTVKQKRRLNHKLTDLIEDLTELQEE
ncbi:DUF6279 family lipoprotein [Thalassomonas actiniarum]|uniref:Lipoprotein n=1 Tax=Thalassomonas actiniarum TaxID=485447 RepID=A0AAE9YPJ3_9GAMM|nr:DUF6279 family lipoprotein [Thalassomonas actiniarum]WDD97848.1 hypothetical protein SG35_021510 [Thalassomonas actiniarum]